MRLYIAEKKKAAYDIASVIGPFQEMQGYLKFSNGDAISWGAGYWCEEEDPEFYTGGFVAAGSLPLIPNPFVSHIIPKRNDRDMDRPRQVKIIADLARQAHVICHACDGDREGQLIGQTIIDLIKWKGPVERFWSSSGTDARSVAEALSKIHDNGRHTNFYLSAVRRREADWLSGFNASIAISRRVKEHHYLGRVKTPTLAMIVARQEAIEGFQARKHYQVYAVLDNGVRATWQMPAGAQWLSEDGLLLDEKVAQAAISRIAGKPAVVQSYDVKQQSRNAPLPHSTVSLAAEASARFGLTAAQTLAASQWLYDAKLITYPRGEGRYIPEGRRDDARETLACLARFPGAPEADPGLKHPAWNTGLADKEAHHGIIPLPFEDMPAGMPQEAAQVYSLIGQNYIRLFHPPELAEARQARVLIAELTFKAASRVVTSPGWTKLGDPDAAGDESKDKPDNEGAALPQLVAGQQLMCSNGDIVAKLTKPPVAYTDGTIGLAMKNIHALVENPVWKAKLKETAGIGTPAGRAALIEELFSDGYLTRKGKSILPSPRGMALIRVLRNIWPKLVDPGWTALFEEALDSVASGALTAEKFKEVQEADVRMMVKAILEATQDLFADLMPKASGFKCECGGDLSAKSFTNKLGRKSYIFRCTGAGCDTAYFRDDATGRPGAKLGTPAPAADQPARESGPKCGHGKCGKPTAVYKTKTDKPYYRCQAGHNFWPGQNGALGQEWAPFAKPGGKTKPAAAKPTHTSAPMVRHAAGFLAARRAG